MAAATNKVFWAFVWYLKNNPYKAAGGLTNDDIDNMAELFATENSTEITDATDQGGTYTDVEWPGTITAVQDVPSVNQANYPEKHKGS